MVKFHVLRVLIRERFGDGASSQTFPKTPHILPFSQLRGYGYFHPFLCIQFVNCLKIIALCYQKPGFLFTTLCSIFLERYSFLKSLIICCFHLYLFGSVRFRGEQYIFSQVTSSCIFLVIGFFLMRNIQLLNLSCIHMSLLLHAQEQFTFSFQESSSFSTFPSPEASPRPSR